MNSHMWRASQHFFRYCIKWPGGYIALILFRKAGLHSLAWAPQTWNSTNRQVRHIRPALCNAHDKSALTADSNSSCTYFAAPLCPCFLLTLWSSLDHLWRLVRHTFIFFLSCFILLFSALFSMRGTQLLCKCKSYKSPAQLAGERSIRHWLSRVKCKMSDKAFM